MGSTPPFGTIGFLLLLSKDIFLGLFYVLAIPYTKLSNPVPVSYKINRTRFFEIAIGQAIGKSIVL